MNHSTTHAGATSGEAFPERPAHSSQTRHLPDRRTVPFGLTYAQAAATLGVSLTTIKRWAAAGKFPVRRLTARTVLIDPTDLRLFWEGSKHLAGQHPPASPKRRVPASRGSLSNRIIGEVQL